MKKVIILLIIAIIPVMVLGCPGIGKLDREAAEQTVATMNERYPEKIAEIRVYRDKLELAFVPGVHDLEKSQIFMEAASVWWTAYPDGEKPGHTLYCIAYEGNIDDDDIGSLQMTRGMTDSQPRISGQPGIYSLRDVR